MIPSQWLKAVQYTHVHVFISYTSGPVYHSHRKVMQNYGQLDWSLLVRHGVFTCMHYLVHLPLLPSPNPHWRSSRHQAGWLHQTGPLGMMLMLWQPSCTKCGVAIHSYDTERSEHLATDHKKQLNLYQPLAHAWHRECIPIVHKSQIYYNLLCVVFLDWAVSYI